ERDLNSEPVRQNDDVYHRSWSASVDLEKHDLTPRRSSPMRRALTQTQKILAAHTIGLTRPWVQAGDVIRIRVDWTIASELAWNGMAKTWEALGKPPVYDRERFYLAIDHTVDPVTLANDARTQRLVQLS